MLKRILLFFLTLSLVVVTVLLITTLTGLKVSFAAHGINNIVLAAIFITWGTLGALLSLLFSKTIAKNNLSITLIHYNHATPTQKTLLTLVEQNAKKLALEKPPEVGIYHSPEINAFVIGSSKNNALLAVSSSLLLMVQQNEIDSITSHEIAQIANGDMVTNTLLQGVLSAFTLFFSSIVAYFVSLALARRQKNSRTEAILTLSYSVLTGMFAIIFTIPSRAVVATFSRWREYRADATSAELTGSENMLAALHCLQNATDLEDETTTFVQAFKITQRSCGLNIFSMQATLEKRIKRLQQQSDNTVLASVGIKQD